MSNPGQLGQHDSVVPEHIEDFGRQELEGHLRRVSELSDRAAAVELRPGGMAARERKHTAYDPFDLQVYRLAAAAAEPLQTTIVILKEALPMTSLYPLARASLEASAFGLWLLTPGTIDARVFRSLQLTRQNRLDADEATRSIKQPNEANLAKFHARLDELKNTRKVLVQKSLDRRFPSTTNVLIEAGKHVVTDSYDPVTAWRVCSGFAHSNNSLMRRFLEQRQTSAFENGSASFYMTSSFVVVASIYETVVDSLDTLVNRYEARAQQP